MLLSKLARSKSKKEKENIFYRESQKFKNLQKAMPTGNIASQGNLDALLNSVSCGELIQSDDVTRLGSRPRHPLCLDAELSVTEGCEALAANKVLSACVAAKGRV